MSTYSKAYREVYFILKYISPRYYSKIPINVLNKIETEMDITYEPNVENNKWMDETKAIIYNLLKDYLATQEQKEILIGNEYLEIQNIEEKKRDNYNPNIFGNNSTTIDEKKQNLSNDLYDNSSNSTFPIVPEKKNTNILQRIINKLKMILGEKKNGSN